MIIEGGKLTLDDVVRVARYGEKVEISEKSLRIVDEGRRRLEYMLEGDAVIYGINTGLGDLVNVKINKKDRKKLQVNLVRSHASGVGNAMPEEVVRAAMLIRVNSLLMGYSGVRREVVLKLVEFLNHKITPVVPTFGSVGASGDLAPLAHVALALIGEGKVKYRGKVRDTKEVLEELNIEPLVLEEKEGLALLNGTAVMAAYGVISLQDSFSVFKNALISASMSFEALHGTDMALDERIMMVRPHSGQTNVARAMREILKDSEIVKNAREEKVQDAYTLRCVPQVYGAVLDALKYAKDVVEREINSVTDNPLIFDIPISGGNFHGEPLALALDFAAIALTDLGNMIERRIARLIDRNLSNLPHFLVEQSGLNSGLMIPQYTAAALCNRNKVISHPASVDTIPTSANQEDHVSMGMTSAQKLREIVENVKYIVAIEYMTANQALHISGCSATAVRAAMNAIGVKKFVEDTVFSEIIDSIKGKIDEGLILREVERKVRIAL